MEYPVIESCDDFELRVGDVTVILGCHGTGFVGGALLSDPHFTKDLPLVLVEAGQTCGIDASSDHVQAFSAYGLSAEEVIRRVKEQCEHPGGVCIVLGPGPREIWAPWGTVHDLAPRLPALAKELSCPVLYQIAMPFETFLGTCFRAPTSIARLWKLLSRAYSRTS